MNESILGLVSEVPGQTVKNFAQAGAAWSLFTSVVEGLANNPAVLKVTPGMEGLSLLANVLNSAPVLDMDKEQVDALGALIAITLSAVFMAQRSV